MMTMTITINMDTDEETVTRSGSPATLRGLLKTIDQMYQSCHRDIIVTDGCTRYYGDDGRYHLYFGI